MENKREYTGGSVSYYRVEVGDPISGAAGYTAECNDIIEALGMNYAEGNAFKAIWRSCAARTLGVRKAGYTDGLYDAEKVQFFGGRMVSLAKAWVSEQDKEIIESRPLPILDDGWIEWGGGGCPVSPNEKVDVRVSSGALILGETARYLMWAALPGRRVVAYRITKDQS